MSVAIGFWLDPEKVKRWEVESAYGRDARDAASADFDRIAAELSGPDETLRRVLTARLHDAFWRGYALPSEEKHVGWEWEFERLRQGRYGNATR